MNWDDVGFLVSKTDIMKILLLPKYSQKTMESVRYNFWWNFKKNKNYLQIGNLLYTTYNSKQQIGLVILNRNFKAFSPIYFDDPQN